MIMSQERSFLKAQTQLKAMCDLMVEAGKEQRRIDEVERDLFAQLLSLGQTLLQAFVNQAGHGDAGRSLTTEDGQSLRRLNGRRPRRYLSIFGEIDIERWVYACREGQKIECVPLDAQLGLPAGDFSYVLEDWLQRMCVKEAFGESVASLRELLNVAPSERAAELMNQRMSEYAEAFRQTQPAPPPQEEAEILVATADAKGVPMRRPLQERIRSSVRRGKGEKANKKQMSCVGAVYTIAPFRRTVDDIVEEVLRREVAANRPKPQHKRVWAEMTSVHEGECCTGKERLFLELIIAVHERDPNRQKTLVCLMDGEWGLWEAKRKWLPWAIGILDLFHVLERLWGVAYCFHPEKSKAAESFVTNRLRMLLQGKVGYVIGGLRRMMDQHDLHGEKRRTVMACIGYYENNREHMRYDEYLAAGYPIGSGVAEGACRHLVKDRMEQTGMRWTLNGAQAMLHLRAIYLNGDWKSYTNYRIEAEQTALYGKAAA
jgi:hypothetical protein